MKALPAKYRYNFTADLGDRARRVYLYQQGQAYWQIAVDTAKQSDNPGQTIDALLGLHNCTYPLDPNKSLIVLNDALKISEHSRAKRARILYEIGFTYRVQQDIEHALEFYSQAKDAASEQKDQELMSTILNDMGYCHAFTGEYKRAGYLVKGGLDLRQERVRYLETQLSEVEGQIEVGPNDSLRQQKEKLENDLPDARLKLGMSFNTLGQIKRFDGDQAAATGAYSEALEIFERENNYLWQARALHSRGEAHRRIAETLYEQDRDKATAEYQKRAERDLVDCIDICKQFGFSTELSTATRRMGRLLHDKALRKNEIGERLEILEKARNKFEDGLMVAMQSDNTWEELENLTELAFLVDDRLDAQKQLSADKRLSPEQIKDGEADIKRFHEYLKDHKEDQLEIYQFQVFVHLLEMEEGAFRFVQGEHTEALEYYLKGYKGLATLPGYGVTRYRQHLDHLFKRIRELNDPEEEKQWCNAFIDTWQFAKYPFSDLTLAQVHPGLVERMQLYLDTAFIFRE